MGESRYCRNINNFNEWVGRSFKEDKRGIFVEKGFNNFDICSVNMVYCNSIMCRQIFQEPIGASH